MPNTPNRAPFNRGTFARRLSRLPDVHVRRREAHRDYYMAKNPDGYQHDLGAQDVFLDNLGIVCFEQMDAHLRPRFFAEIDRSMHRWERTRQLVLDVKPWLGEYIDAKPKTETAAGEPRPRLRLLEQQAYERRSERSAPGAEDANYRTSWPGDLAEMFGVAPGDEGTAQLKQWEHQQRPYGLILPERFSSPVSDVRLLPITECTPDLPTRVGVTAEDLRMYQDVGKDRDQGQLGTCGAFATTFAIELAARRRDLTIPSLSTAWLHLASGTAVTEGRNLLAVVESVLEEGLPCAEEELPYQALLEGRIASFEAIPQGARTDSCDITDAFGVPEVVRIAPDNMGYMKTLLAAGWVVLLATAMDEHFQSPAAMVLGLPLLPLVGSRRVDAHAWCVVGYEHTDGALNWKYQGHLIALNSWGTSAHTKSPYGRGTISLPFSFVHQHAFDAFAVRFLRP